MPKSTWDFLKIGLSAVLRYFASIGSSEKIRRAPNPTTSPPRSFSGQSSLRRNLSIGPWRPSLARPAV
jgi:hypothetical protein